MENFVEGDDGMAKVVALYICPDKLLPMQRVEMVRAIAGVGLEGDRYAIGKGSYSGVPNLSNKSMSMRHVTLISLRDIADANLLLDQSFTVAETRRNIVLDSAIHLFSLIGMTFTIGGVKFHPFEDCAPCALPGKLAGKPGFEKAFVKKGGIRAEILSDGVIEIGDELVVE